MNAKILAIFFFILELYSQIECGEKIDIQMAMLDVMVLDRKNKIFFLYYIIKI